MVLSKAVAFVFYLHLSSLIFFYLLINLPLSPYKISFYEIICVILQRLGRSRREFLQPSRRQRVFYYELDYPYCRRALRGWFYILSGSCEGNRRHTVVVLDGRFHRFYSLKYGTVGKSHADPAPWNGISRMDRYRSRGHSAYGNSCFSRARNPLAAVFHNHTDSLYCRT